ncbi:SDR family oxidoreductase [Bacillus spongiae]|uniref:SDR family oxidoreductase n=1 Tax=Bacillus spongiae TaxID=2683610 RepID=A0ABU8HCB9_9BACI
MRFLIIGGTRFLGRYLVESAKEKGHSITLFNRGKSNPSLFKDIERIIGDRENERDLEKLRDKEWDVVIDTCGYTPEIVSKSVEILSNKVGQYIFISSGSVYKNLFHEDEINEESEIVTLSKEELDSVTEEKSGRFNQEYYGPLKYLSEQEVIKKMDGKCLIVRSGLIVGPNDSTDRFTYWPYRVSLGGNILAPDNEERKVQFIDVRDLAKWIILMAEKNETGIFNVTGPKRKLSMGELLHSCKRVLNTDANFVWASKDFLVAQNVQPWIELPLWVPTDSDYGMNFEKAIEKGLEIRPISDTIRDTFAWNQNRKLESRRAGLSLEREKDILKEWFRNH